MVVGMNSLPRDLTEEILCKLPVTSMRAIRLTCKKWNTLSKNRSFAKKHIGKLREECRLIMIGYDVFLMGFDLNGIQSNNIDPSLKLKGKLIFRNDVADQVDISLFCHCDGLFLCYARGLVVWNPYWGEKRWIRPRGSYSGDDIYALGYEEKKSRSHKILRLLSSTATKGFFEYHIFDFKYNSWRVTTIYLNMYLDDCGCGVSLKGNTYWAATGSIDIYAPSLFQMFLVSFDFTKEEFGPRLHYPIRKHDGLQRVTLSSVRGEQLVVLFQFLNTFEIEIWVTSEIKPTMVSWTKFLAVEMKPFLDPPTLIGSFFIDEEKKVAVFVDKDGKDGTRNMAYIIGVDGYFRKVGLGEAAYRTRWPFACSYLPSSVHIKRPIGSKRKQIMD